MIKSDLKARGRAVLAWLIRESGAADGRLMELEPLSGGAIQENWSLRVALEGGALPGEGRYVLRRDAPVTLPVSHPRAAEFALLKVAEAAGLPVPRPLYLCEDPGVAGGPFYLMSYVGGASDPRDLMGVAAMGEGDALVFALGGHLARLHALAIPLQGLPFITVPEGRPARHRVATFRRHLDALPGASPTLQWALNWLDAHAPDEEARSLCHLDFRTGNLRVEGAEVVAILDWEFAEYASPMEDLGWFTARCWRFGAWGREAGGIGSRAAFYRGYEDAGGEAVDDKAVRYYEVMAALRWAVVALQQGDRALALTPPSLLHALTGQMAPELEWELLTQIPAWERRFSP